MPCIEWPLPGYRSQTRARDHQRYIFGIWGKSFAPQSHLRLNNFSIVYTMRPGLANIPRGGCLSVIARKVPHDSSECSFFLSLRARRRRAWQSQGGGAPPHQVASPSLRKDKYESMSPAGLSSSRASLDQLLESSGGLQPQFLPNVQ